MMANVVLTCYMVRNVLSFHIPVCEQISCDVKLAFNVYTLVASLSAIAYGKGKHLYLATPTSPSLASCQLRVNRMFKDLRSPASRSRHPSIMSLLPLATHLALRTGHEFIHHNAPASQNRSSSCKKLPSKQPEGGRVSPTVYDIDIMQEVHAASHIKGNVLALHVPRQLPWLPRHSVLVVHIQRRPQVTAFTELCNPSNISMSWCLCRCQMTHGVC